VVAGVALAPAGGFCAHIRKRWFGNFVGTIEDDIHKETGAVATIEGSYWVPKISFLKTFPSAWFRLDDGNLVSAEEFVAIKYQGSLSRPSPKMVFYYEGQFDRKSGKFRGRWSNDAYLLEMKREGLEHKILVPQASGPWEMCRERMAETASA
jgi:hypothetical protein